MNKYRETPPLKKGDMVVMHTCVEARNPKNYGKVWRCRTDQFSRGTGVYEQHSVFLEGFTGSFAAEYLQKVDIPDQSEEVERLKGQLQDALTVISDALTDVMDMLEVSEMERRDMELCPQANMLSLHDELNAAIQRIQEGEQANESRNGCESQNR